MLAPNGAPARPLAVERPTSVIPVPVGIEGERLNGQTDSWAVVDDGYAPTLVEIGQLLPGNPAACVTPAHIAPAIAAHTAVHIHPRVRRDAVDHGKIVSGACPQIGGSGDHRRKCRRKVRREYEPGHRGGQAEG